jgi:hypothetical protein
MKDEAHKAKLQISASSILVSRKKDLINFLVEVAKREKDKAKIMVLLEVFKLSFAQAREFDKLLKELETKL